MIQIDDAGWGSLVGGMIIGVYDTTTGQFESGLVPPTFFQGADFAAQRYLGEAADQAARCFARLGITEPGPGVEVCTGYALQAIRGRLDEAGFDWRLGKIEGPLQERVERAFWFHLRDVGFRVDWADYADPDKRGLLWWKQVQWLKGGDVNATAPHPERAKVCKTGWGSYEIWARHPYREAKRLAQKRRAGRRRRAPSRAFR